MPGSRPLLLIALHVAGLWAIAVVQPLLDVLGRAPEFFVAHRAGATDILVLLALLLLAAPLVLTALIAVTDAISSRASVILTGTVVFVLVGLIAVQVAKQAGITTWSVAIGPAAAAGFAGAMLYARYAGVRSFFTMLAASILIVPVVFAQRPGIRRQIVPNTTRWKPAEPGQPGFHAAPVVLMVFDELPLVSLLDSDRNIDPALYPNLSALAHDGVWFRNATTVSDYTRFAVPAILTGRRPKRDDVPVAGDHPDTLFSFLSRTHRLEVTESATALCPRSLCAEPSDTFGTRLASMGGDLAVVAAYVFLTPDLHKRLRLPDLTANWGGFSAAGADAGMDVSPRAWQRHVDQRFRDDRRQLVKFFLDNISSSDQQPTFYFFHALLPHQPWVLLPTGQRNSSLAPLPSPYRVAARTDDWEIAQNQQRHLLQVGFMDHVVGRLIARLKQTGLYERALVVVIADHGIALTKGESVRTLSLGNAGEVMRIPLIMKLPAGVQIPLSPQVNIHGQRVSDRNVETIDIAPTVAHVVGLRLPWATDGASLLDDAVPPRGKKQITGGNGNLQQYGVEGPSIDAVLRQRVETFGAANKYRIPKPPRFGELVGHPVADYRVVASPEVTDLRYPSLYARFDPDADAVPFDVSGDLRGHGEGTPPVYIAVAVNDVIQAVTRTWTSRTGWLATPPLEAWHRGPNSVDVYLIEESDGHPVLARVQRPTSRPDDLNLMSGAAEHYWDVRIRGFQRHERMGDGFIRWTRADASVTLALLGRKPVGVRVKIARALNPAAKLMITANGCTIYDAIVPTPEWEATLPLAGCRITGDELTVRLTTNATRPAGQPHATKIGVAVRHIILQSVSADARH
jgi:arylsulfatase A-like enzyme